MKVYSIWLMSKNNKQRGSYYYLPLIVNNGRYFYGQTIISKHPIKAADISPNEVEIKREIEPKFYAANGIPAKANY